MRPVGLRKGQMEHPAGEVAAGKGGQASGATLSAGVSPWLTVPGHPKGRPGSVPWNSQLRQTPHPLGSNKGSWSGQRWFLPPDSQQEGHAIGP